MDTKPHTLGRYLDILLHVKKKIKIYTTRIFILNLHSVGKVISMYMFWIGENSIQSKYFSLSFLIPLQEAEYYFVCFPVFGVFWKAAATGVT